MSLQTLEPGPLHTYTADEFLDLARSKLTPATDYQLAKVLGTSQSTVCNWRSGRSLPDQAFCLRIADLAGFDAGFVFLCIEAQRALPDATRHETWLHVIRRLQNHGGVTAAALLAVALLYPPQAGAADLASVAGLYIMSTCIRGLLDRLTPGRTSPAGYALLVTL